MTDVDSLTVVAGGMSAACRCSISGYSLGQVCPPLLTAIPVSLCCAELCCCCSLVLLSILCAYFVYGAARLLLLGDVCGVSY